MRWVKETGVPIPPEAKRGGNEPTELSRALKSLEPSENLLVVDADRGRVSSCYSTIARNHGYKFVTRLMDDGLRVWRVE